MIGLQNSDRSGVRTYADDIYERLNGSPSALVVVIGILLTAIGLAISNGVTAGMLTIYGIGITAFGGLSYLSIKLLQYLS